MKSIFHTEWRNFSADRDFATFSKIEREAIGVAKYKSNRPWVAEITGECDKFKLARKFIKGELDFSESNSKGSRGVLLVFVLEIGKYYELKDSRGERSFLMVEATGEAIEVEEERVLTAIAHNEVDKIITNL